VNRIFTAFTSLAALAGLLSLTGCSEPAAETPEKTISSEKSTPSSSKDTKKTETWDVLLIQGSRVGYGHNTIRTDIEDGRPVVRVESVNHVSIPRGGQPATMDASCSSVETPEGRLLHYESEALMSQSPLRTVGRVHDGKLDLEVTSAGSKIPLRQSISWPKDGGGPIAMEQSLLRKPMLPGEHRTIKFLMIDINQTAVMELSAKQYESTPLLNGAYELLCIENVIQLSDGKKIKGKIWINRAGESLKTITEAMEGIEMVTYRATEAEALKKADAAKLDLMLNTMVKVEQRFPDSFHTKQVRYRVHLKDGDPVSSFVTGPTQAIKSIDPETAEITVYAIRPGRSDGNRNAPADPPTDDDLRPNNFIQSDDPLIVADAKKAAGDEKDPWRVAAALERYVHREVKNKNYSQAFASASEVAKSLEGDCTEHAVFLAALARARGIPARVAMGLIYVKDQRAFLYHLWTEVYIEGRWIPIDGTLALGGIGADHLKIGQSNLKGASAYSAFMPVLEVANRLRIEIVDVQ
jgi:hypothetical protein